MVEQAAYKVHFILKSGEKVIVEKEVAQLCTMVSDAIEEDPDCEDHEAEGEENRRWDVEVIRSESAEGPTEQPKLETLNNLIKYLKEFCVDRPTED